MPFLQGPWGLASMGMPFLQKNLSTALGARQRPVRSETETLRSQNGYVCQTRFGQRDQGRGGQADIHPALPG
jgi:hypothetical protein